MTIKKLNTKTSKIDNQVNFDEINLESLSKQDLIQMLYSTAEYEHFVEYYTDHELSFMNSLNGSKSQNKDQY